MRHLGDRAWDQGRRDQSRDLNHVIACLQDSADAWNNYAFLCRVAYRYYYPSNTFLSFGFRVALFADPSARTAPIVTTVAAVPGVGEGTFTVSGSVTNVTPMIANWRILWRRCRWV